MTNTSLSVLQAGPYISVQDEGRPGWLRSGVSQGGAMDLAALEDGRLLVGNPRGLGAIEMLGLGGRFQAGERPLCAALTGACFPARIEGKAVEPYTSFTLQPRKILEISAAETGNYGLLSIAGGIITEPVLGSRSTHVRAGFGGYEGRCLKQGDVLPVGAANGVSGGYQLPYMRDHFLGEVRILWGSQVELFGQDELVRFQETHFEVTHDMDRMGARLTSEAAPIHSAKGLVAISGPIALGDIQVPGHGRPIVLLADRQTTGGYPRIATIIAADLAGFAQCPAGSKLRFKPVSEYKALEALGDMHERRATRGEQLVKKSDDPYESTKLLSENLISGVVSSFDKVKNEDVKS